VSEYLLGTTGPEIRRLDFQARLWAPMTEGLLDRLGVGRGWRCLDVGAGIGSVALPLARRVGPRGSVTALEVSPLYAGELRRRLSRARAANVRVVEGDLRAFAVERGAYDLIFSRWVFSFLPDVEACLRRLVPGLAPGGILAIEDYHHLGCAFYPRLPSLDETIEAVRRWYRRSGGNPRVAGELPAAYARLGLKRIEVEPHVRVGGPRSDLWRWAELFLLGHLDRMVADGAASPSLARRFRRDYLRVRRRPQALFVSPPIFDVVGRRPGPWSARPSRPSSAAPRPSARAARGTAAAATSRPRRRPSGSAR
jgi:SAM-dependent methyltransferase